MKKLLFIIGLAFVVSSCSDQFGALNDDIKNPAEVPSGALISNAQMSLFDYMTSTSVNVNTFRLWSQQWAQTTYPDESNYELIERNVNGEVWDRMYSTVIRDCKEAAKFIDADAFLSDSEKVNQKAILKVMEVLAYATLVDVFGDIPFAEAFSEDITPAYDDDEEVYGKLFDMLNTAISELTGASAMGTADLIYGGDTDSWRKFANSLKLRMAIRIADHNDAMAKTMAEAAISDGVLGAGEGFFIRYGNATPHTNPLWESLVQSGRSDFICSNTIADYMNGLEDPRRWKYFSGPQDSVGGLIGGLYGDANNYNNNSQPGLRLEDPTLIGIIMGFPEINFLLADAAERGYAAGGTAEDFYHAGIRASMINWQVNATAIDNYLANPDVAYSTAPGTWKEKIAMQKWLALYNEGLEAWNVYRMYDAPVMNVAVGAGTTPPLRFTYPVTEYSLNGASVEAAAAAIGGDEPMSRVFWDKN